MHRYQFSLWVVLVAGVFPGFAIQRVVGQPPVADPFAVDGRGPFEAAPQPNAPVRDQRFLELRTKQMNNTIDSIQIQAESYGKQLRKFKQDKLVQDASIVESLIAGLASKLWFCRVENERLKIESLKLRIQEIEQGIDEREASKAKEIANLVTEITDGTKARSKDSETPQDE